MSIEKTLQEIKARFGQSSELLASDKIFIESNYERVTNKVFRNRGCGECYKDAFIEMYYEITKNGLRKMNQYKLKREEIVRLKEVGTNGEEYFAVYNRASLTDEKAIKYLIEHPKGISLFESYPEDWESQLADQPAEVKKSTKKTKQKENVDEADQPAEV